MAIKENIKSIAKKLGIDIRLHSPRSDQYLRLVQIMNKRNISLILDVGANKGQFATSIFKAGYTGRIISFEPLPDAWSLLCKAAATSPHKWQIAEPFAIDDCDGEVEIHVADNSASSSLLEQSTRMKEVAPFAKATKKILVKKMRLEDAVARFDLGTGGIFLKIDTQGSELGVLCGTDKLFDRLSLVLVEASIARLYKGQPAYFELDQFIREKGFSLIDIEPGFRSPLDLELLEYDALYAIQK